MYVDNNDILNDLLDNLKVCRYKFRYNYTDSAESAIFLLHVSVQDLLFNLKSLTQWLKSYWYWVLASFGGLSKIFIELYRF